MKFAAIIPCVFAISGFFSGQAQAWDRYRSYGYDDYRYGHAESWRSYERGYKGEPRFFRGFHDDVDYRPDFYGFYEERYVQREGRLYSGDRGYGVEGRGWQLP